MSHSCVILSRTFNKQRQERVPVLIFYFEPYLQDLTEFSVGQRVIMSRVSYKWDQKVRNGDGNQIMSDFIHKREFIVYSPLVEPTPMQGLHHFCVFKPNIITCLAFKERRSLVKRSVATAIPGFTLSDSVPLLTRYDFRSKLFSSTTTWKLY